MPRLDEAIVTNVGLRVAELREAQGLTQTGLAELMGVELRNAQRYELGANLTLTTLVRLARVLNVQPAAFFEQASRVRRAAGRPRATVHESSPSPAPRSRKRAR